MRSYCSRRFSSSAPLFHLQSSPLSLQISPEIGQVYFFSAELPRAMFRPCVFPLVQCVDRKPERPGVLTVSPDDRCVCVCVCVQPGPCAAPLGHSDGCVSSPHREKEKGTASHNFFVRENVRGMKHVRRRRRRRGGAGKGWSRSR